MLKQNGFYYASIQSDQKSAPAARRRRGDGRTADGGGAASERGGGAAAGRGGAWAAGANIWF